MPLSLDLERLDHALTVLSQRLRARNAPPTAIVVCGGASLIALGMNVRTTRDVDVIALRSETGTLEDPDPFPEHLVEAAREVQRILGLHEDWLNNQPSRGDGGLFRMGLPSGLERRLHRRDYGDRLSVWFIGRLDQIHLKLYAAVDRGGYHIADLISLTPTPSEIEQASHWAMTHDVSEGFRALLAGLLKDLGYGSVAERI